MLRLQQLRRPSTEKFAGQSVRSRQCVKPCPRSLPTFCNSFVACSRPKVLHASALNVARNERSWSWMFVGISGVTYTHTMSLCIKSEVRTYPCLFTHVTHVHECTHTHTHEVEYPAHLDLIRLQPFETKPFLYVYCWRQTTTHRPQPSCTSIARVRDCSTM